MGKRIVVLMVAFLFSLSIQVFAEFTVDDALLALKTSHEGQFLQTDYWFSKDPSDLDPIRGTKWSFTYTIVSSWTDTLTFGSQTEYSTDGVVALTSRDQYGDTGYVFYCETPLPGLPYAFSSATETILFTQIHVFEISGPTAWGYYIMDTGIVSSYDMTGIKISGPTTTSIITTTTTAPVITTTTTTIPVVTTTTTPQVTTTTVPKTYSISGYVREDISANISIKLTGTASKNTVTNQDGYYSFSDLSGGYYTITPEHEECEFDPTNYVVQNLTSNLSSMDFVSTEIKTTPCAAEAIYGEDSEETELLRYYRDSVLKQTPEGRELIKLYYQWSPFIIDAMKSDQEFKEEVKQMIDKFLHR